MNKEVKTNSSNLPIRRGIEKKEVSKVFIESLKVDFRRSPRMEHPTLDLTNDLLFESKLNKKFLEESFI
ncbi:hypothetical protein COU58_04190 [Candidatus Pacearchaeota archaeon CG10_big_fil_rev_8_21_14_0_10_32_42]|nr:MAG: hypothetical protein COU58_04190 [Candidatus Pacearchaeota archaeon CG10_big_fil_rev_8_21_14_0_10_32_42]